MARKHLRHATGLVSLAALLLGAIRAEHPTSPASAERLKQLLVSRQAEAAAAEDPDEPGRFVAALLLPEQLLVVTARCASVEHLRRQVEQRASRDLYAGLHGCAIPSTKLFVQDMGADGIQPQPEPGKVPDVVYDKVSHVVVLNGDWRKQELDEEGYLSQFGALDTRYNRMLQLLIGAANRKTED
jgi:hypothetical protein